MDEKYFQKGKKVLINTFYKRNSKYLQINKYFKTKVLINK